MDEVPKKKKRMGGVENIKIMLISAKNKTL